MNKTEVYYSVDNKFGEVIAMDLESWERASYVAQRYLAVHEDDTVTVYSSDGESWELTAKDFASATMGQWR